MITIKEALDDGSLSLEDEIDYADMTEEEYKQEIERLNNIIEEVREYINNGYLSDGEMVNILAQQELLEILDKENK